MTQRSVVVRLSMEASQYIGEAQKAGKVGEDAMRRVERAAKSSDQAIQDIGSTAGKAAAGGLATLFATGKAASDWESQWAGVTKTVEGTPEQLAAVEKGIRDLATSMPATHQEIAGVAEAAGALGVKTKDVVDFTEQMVMLGETTDDLSAEEAATSIARFRNVLKMAPGDVDNFAAALVDLGNNGASTEGEIMAMAARVAGAGTTIGATEQDVLALSASMANLGIESELGGGAMQRVLTMINTDVKSGSKDVAKYAEVAGVSSEKFADAWGKRPVQAFDMLVRGLGKIQDNGGDVASVLGDMGIKGTQNLQVMLRMAGAGDGLTKTLEQSGAAWSENSALVEEYGKRAETTDSQVTIAWNNIRNAGIEAGAVLLPMVASVAGGVADIASAFAGLSDPVQSGVTYAVMALTGAGGLVWATTKTIAAVQSTQASMVALGVATEVTSKKIILGRMAMVGAGGLVAGMTMMADESTTTGKAIEAMGLTAGGALMGFAMGGPVGAAVGGGIGLIAGLGKAMLGTKEDAEETSPSIDGLAETFDGLSGSATRATRALALQKLEQTDMLPILGRLGISQRDMIDASLGNEAALKRVNKVLRDQRAAAKEGLSSSDLDQRMDASKWAGDVEQAAGALKSLGLEMTGAKQKAIELSRDTEDLSVLLKGLPEEVRTDIKQNGVPDSIGDVKRLKTEYKDLLTPKQVKILTQISGTQQAIREIREAKQAANELDGTTATVTTVYRTTRVAGSGRPGPQIDQADGGIVEFYAAGGIRENHVAQIASRGTTRVWNEPETEGEAYIPLAASKRARSLDIWMETGRHLGVELYANGGTTGGRTPKDRLKSMRSDLREMERRETRMSTVLEQLTERAGGLSEALDGASEAADYWGDKAQAVADASLSRFEVDLFGEPGAVPEPWSTDVMQAAATPEEAIDAAIAEIEERMRITSALEAGGMTGDAIAAFLGQGTNEELAALVADPSRIPGLAAKYNTYAALMGSARAQAGGAAYGPELALSRASEQQARQAYDQAERLAIRQAGLLEQLEHAIERMGNRIDKQTDQMKDQPERIGARVGQEIRGEVARGARG